MRVRHHLLNISQTISNFCSTSRLQQQSFKNVHHTQKPSHSTYSTVNETLANHQRQEDKSHNRPPNTYQSWGTVDHHSNTMIQMAGNRETNISNNMETVNLTKPTQNSTKESNVNKASYYKYGAIPKRVCNPVSTLSENKNKFDSEYWMKSADISNQQNSLKPVHQQNQNQGVKTTIPSKAIQSSGLDKKSSGNGQKAKLHAVSKKKVKGKENILTPVLRPSIKIKPLLQVIKVLQNNVEIPSKTKKRHFYIGKDTFDDGKAIQISVDRGTDFTDTKSKRNTVFNNPGEFVLCKVIKKGMKLSIFENFNYLPKFNL